MLAGAAKRCYLLGEDERVCGLRPTRVDLVQLAGDTYLAVFGEVVARSFHINRQMSDMRVLRVTTRTGCGT